jgi:hypothetical protein
MYWRRYAAKLGYRFSTPPGCIETANAAVVERSGCIVVRMLSTENSVPSAADILGAAAR